MRRGSIKIEDKEVQCPLCLRYHEIQQKVYDEEDVYISEVFCGTVKVMGAAGAVAMLLSKNEGSLKQLEFLSPTALPSGILRTKSGECSPNFGRIAMGAMIFTGMILTVWNWVHKQKQRRQREEEFRANLEICKECWTGIREVLVSTQ